MRWTEGSSGRRWAAPRKNSAMGFMRIVLEPAGRSFRALSAPGCRIVTVAVMPETSGTWRHPVDGNANRHALRKAHPGVDGVDIGQAWVPAVAFDALMPRVTVLRVP